jgi:uncharacterized protein YggE
MSAKQRLITLLAVFLLALAPVTLLAHEGENKNTFPQAKITSEGMVKAYPDIAVLNFTILTESPKAQMASIENARKADSFLGAVKKFLHEGDTVKSTGYRIIPLYTYGDKMKKPAITGYRGSHGFQVRIKELPRLGDLIDLAVQQGVNEINGPYWQHSGLDALTREASVQALQKAKQMAEALAGSQGLKVKRLQKVSTGTRVVPYPRDEAKVMRAAAGPDAVATPIEVGEQEIRAQIEAVFELE